MGRQRRSRRLVLILTLLCLEVAMTHELAAADGPSAAAPSTGLAFLDALAAPGPAPSLGEAVDTYAWLIGSWDVDVVDHPPGGPTLRSTGEWHFAWILEGRAVGDVWIVPPRGQRTEPPGPGNRYGMSVRVFDRDLGAWRVTWFNPVTGVENRLIGRREGADVVHTGTDGDGRPMRWTFTQIHADSFVWRGEASNDGGETWQLEAEFRGRRRPVPAATASDARRGLPGPVRWEWTDRPGLEALVLSTAGETVTAESELLVVADGVPTRVSYRLTYDRGWRFRSGWVRAVTAGEVREVELEYEGDGGWRVDGAPRPDLDGCADLDVMATPFTNTPPLRRLDLAPGASAALRVAWVRFPDLAVKPVRQEYRRLDDAEPPRRFLYRNLESGFEGELTVDADRLVLTYGPWRRVPAG